VPRVLTLGESGGYSGLSLCVSGVPCTGPAPVNACNRDTNRQRAPITCLTMCDENEGYDRAHVHP
jgi:hypothetical protein